MIQYTWELLIMVLIFLLIMTLFVIYNVYLVVRREKTRLTVFFHIASILSLACLYYLVLILPFDSKKEMYILIALFVIWFLWLCLHFIFGRAFHFRKPSPHDLQTVFQSLDMLVLVFAHDGKLLRYNHKDRFFTYFCCQDMSMQVLEGKIDMIRVDGCNEVFFKEIETYCALTKTPIFYRQKCVGYTFSFYDITETKRLILSIEESNQILQAYQNQLENERNISDAVQVGVMKKELIDEVHRDMMKAIEYELERLSTDYLSREVFLSVAMGLRKIYKNVRKVIRTLSNE